eukprot:gene8865-1219_t
MWEEIKCENAGPKEGFERACHIFAERFHVVNRRLVCCDIVATITLPEVNSSTLGKAIAQIIQPHVLHKEGNDSRTELSAPALLFPLTEDGVFPFLPELMPTKAKGDTTVIIRHLISRMPNTYPHTWDAVLLTKQPRTITVIPLQSCVSSMPSFRFSWKENKSPLLLFECFLDDGGNPHEPFVLDEVTDRFITSKHDNNASSLRWLNEKLFPKMLEWTLYDEPGKFAQWRADPTQAMVSLVEYAHKYQQLKAKYASYLVEGWPETTDPQKFVFEELGIAAYLCILFDRIPSLDLFPNKFVDLGCGNGLLTYVLNQEGYPGIGIDLRRRRIWDWYSPAVTLLESTVTPQLGCTYPDCEWLIGNHSDELTPWIPVMSTISMRYQHIWVLPCCPFDLDGSKHTTSSRATSQYDSYLSYVYDLLKHLDFCVSTDVLRIPSTKRVCMTTIYTKALTLQQENCKASPKPKHQVARNCTGLPRSFLDECILVVVSEMLSLSNAYVSSELTSSGKWHLGGCMKMNDVAKILGSQRLKHLKSECGGVKTLLKNHRQVFEVQGNVARICNWTQPDRKLPSRTKTKLCWFFQNHPDGCPRSATMCPFLHGENDSPEYYTGMLSTSNQSTISNNTE